MDRALLLVSALLTLNLEVLSFTGGLRYDDNSAFGGQFSPRLYSVFRATGDWTVKGGVGRGYRAPFLEQLEDGIIGYGNQGLDPLFGNPDLRPELSTNVEVSAQYDGGGIVSGFATLFHTELTDKIERPVAATGGLTDNVAEAILQGLETPPRVRLTPDWTLGGEYTFTHSEVTTFEAQGTNRGDPLVGVRSHMLNGRVRWTAVPNLSLTLGGQYRSSRHRPESVHEPQLGGSAQGASEALGDFRRGQSTALRSCDSSERRRGRGPADTNHRTPLGPSGRVGRDGAFRDRSGRSDPIGEDGWSRGGGMGKAVARVRAAR